MQHWESYTMFYLVILDFIQKQRADFVLLFFEVMDGYGVRSAFLSGEKLFITIRKCARGTSGKNKFPQILYAYKIALEFEMAKSN